ncbi:cytochrome b561 domain-containing protein [Rhodotorula paludigena]|uniref:cytochrome b561 domain-containing protein n=1 Tax=Rhodotorula paludigena TaxID=86838 RepID=UPI00317DDE31
MLWLAILLSLLCTCTHALTGDQVRSVFPSSFQDLHGETVELPSFDLTVLHDADRVLFVVNATDTPPSQIGWFGTGAGSHMADADFLLAWPTISGSSVNWTLSHRLPNTAAPEGHGLPSVASGDPSTSTTAFYTLVPELTTTEASSPYSAVAWTRARSPGSSYPTASGVATTQLGDAQTSFIYGSSSENPGNADETAPVRRHNQPMGATTINFQQAVALDDLDGGAVSRSSAGRTARDKGLIAHATLGSLALLIFTPSAILLARLGRDSFRWFPPHWMLNLFSTVLVIVTFALGVKYGGGEFDDFHKRLGLALFLLVLVQALLGFLAHRTMPTLLTSSCPSFRSAPADPAHPRRIRTPLPRISHILVGLVTVALGWTQLASGIDGEWQSGSDAQSAVPRGVWIVFWALVALWIAAYLAAWVWGVVGKKGARAAQQERRAIEGDKGLMSVTTRGTATP